MCRAKAGKPQAASKLRFSLPSIKHQSQKGRDRSTARAVLAEHLALTPSSPHAPQYPSSGRSPDVDTSAKPWVGVKQSPEACEVQLCWVPLQASYKASFKGTYMVWGSVKPTITGRRFNGSPSHGKRLACLHLPHPDDFVMEGLQRASCLPPWTLRRRACLHRKRHHHGQISGSSHAAATDLGLDSSQVPTIRCPAVAGTRQGIARKTAEVQLHKEPRG